MSALTDLETSAAMIGYGNVSVGIDAERNVAIVQCEDAEHNLMSVEGSDMSDAISRMQERISSLLGHE